MPAGTSRHSAVALAFFPPGTACHEAPPVKSHLCQRLAGPGRSPRGQVGLCGQAGRQGWAFVTRECKSQKSSKSSRALSPPRGASPRPGTKYELRAVVGVPPDLSYWMEPSGGHTASLGQHLARSVRRLGARPSTRRGTARRGAAPRRATRCRTSLCSPVQGGAPATAAPAVHRIAP